MADCTAADTLLDRLPATMLLHGDKGYDSDAVREKIEARGIAPNIPPKSNRLKDYRRIATRSDRLAQNFLAAVCLAATVSYWL